MSTCYGNRVQYFAAILSIQFWERKFLANNLLDTSIFLRIRPKGLFNKVSFLVRGLFEGGVYQLKHIIIQGIRWKYIDYLKKYGDLLVFF